MAEITAAMVKELRERTQAGMMECKKALQEAGGDMNAAAEILAKKGASKAQGKAGKIAAEGLVNAALTADGRHGVMVEVNCQTDFVAKGDDFKALLAAATDGIPLLVRTLALRAILLVTTWVAAGLGEVPLAAHQVTATIWGLLTFALDALAIAGQALTGKALGAGDIGAAREATTVMIRWGIWGGVVLGVVTLAAHRMVPVLFTSDPAVRAAMAAALVVVALGQPLSGYVFVVDGVLIGAGDTRWLAWAMGATLAAYVPVALVVRAVAPTDPPTAMVWLWAGFTWFMVVRGALLRWRVRGDAWMVTGATR